MWIDPLAQKVYADFKNCLNKFHIISERLAFQDSNFGRNDRTNFKIVLKKLA